MTLISSLFILISMFPPAPRQPAKRIHQTYKSKQLFRGTMSLLRCGARTGVLLCFDTGLLEIWRARNPRMHRELRQGFSLVQRPPQFRPIVLWASVSFEKPRDGLTGHTRDFPPFVLRLQWMPSSFELLTSGRIDKLLLTMIKLFLGTPKQDNREIDITLGIRMYISEILAGTAV